MMPLQGELRVGLQSHHGRLVTTEEEIDDCPWRATMRPIRALNRAPF